MIKSWFEYLRKGLSRRVPKDRISEDESYTDFRKNIKNLSPFFLRHWKKSLAGVFLILLTTLLTFPQPLITRFLIDHVILAKQLSFLVWIILLYAAVVVSHRLAGMLENFFFVRYEQIVILDIQKDLLERALRFPKTFFDTNQTGYLMSRLSSDVQGLRWFFSSTFVYIISNILRFIGGLVFLFYLEWRLAFGIFIILPFLVLGVRFFARKTHSISHHGMERRARVHSDFQESLSSMPLIKAFSQEVKTVRRLMSALRSSFRISLEQTTVQSLANLAIDAVPTLARGAVLGLGAYFIIQGEWTLGSLMAFQAYMGYVFGPALFLASANLDLQNARASLERVSALFDIVPEEKKEGRKVKHLTGSIEFKKVSFSYNPEDPVLQDVSFRIAPGAHVAVVGPSGVGKTTLLSLVLRFYLPNSGEIYFDGHPASEYHLESLRRRIGYVSQDPMLLEGTILDNLRYGNPGAKEEEVIQAAETAGIHDFISGLPRGYRSHLGEKGVNLSGGQKQRLTIARALVRDPDILILDEPTSALDSQTEKTVFEALPLQVKNKTMLIVSSRLSTIKKSSRILLLNENRLVAVGTHQSLWETDEYYRSLVSYQMA